jgi:cell division protein FtsB
MPPKPCQLRAPRPKQSGNTFQALVDLPEDGSNSTFDGRDEKVDESDGFSTGNMLQRAPSAASEAPSPPPRHTTDHGESPVRKWRQQLVNDGVYAYVLGAEIDCSAENILQYYTANAAKGAHVEWLIEQRTAVIGDDMESTFQTVFDKLDNLTRKVDKMALEEVALHKAYRQSTAETAALKATVDTLTKQLDEYIIFPALPLPDPATSPSAMEEMTMQLSHVQHDIQDVLAAVRNPPGKRKRRGSDHNTEPTTPTNQRLATNKQRDASPEHSLMHSQHATSAAQDALDAVIRKYPPKPLAITSTEATTDPLPNSHAVQDTTLPDAPTTTAPAEKDGWYLFIYSSYSLATVRLWRRLHILITKLVLWLLPQVPTGIRPGAVVRFGGVVPHCYPCVCSISRLLFPEPCLLGGHLAGLSSISSSLPLPFLVLFPAFVSSTVHTSI